MLAGCSSHTIDHDGWKQELATAGTTVADWGKYEAAVLLVCKDDDPSMFLAASMDSGSPSMCAVEINYKYACPDRMDNFKSALNGLNESRGAADLACKTPAAERTEDQQMLAEALAC